MTRFRLGFCPYNCANPVPISNTTTKQAWHAQNEPNRAKAEATHSAWGRKKWSDSLQWVERIAPGGGAIRPTPHGFNGREEVSRTNEKPCPRPKYLVIRFFQKNCCDWHGTCMFFVESNLDSLLAEVTFLKTALSRCRLFKEMFS
jgi:hypothetical protein